MKETELFEPTKKILLDTEIDTIDTEIAVCEVNYAMWDIDKKITKDNDNVVTTYCDGRHTQ